MGVTTLAKAGNSDLEVVQYATLADRPTAANFGIGKNIVSNAAYTIESVSDGTEYYSQGHSASLADRPSAATFGKGVWQINGIQYVSDGTNWRLNDATKKALRQKHKTQKLPLIQAAAWATGTAYVINDIVRHSNGQLLLCVVAGTSHGTTEPTFSSTALMTDNTASWAWLGRKSKVNSDGYAVPAITTSATIPTSATLHNFYDSTSANGEPYQGTITGGSGYVDGTYTNVPLTGGDGTGAVALSITVSGGAVTAVKLDVEGTGSGYKYGNTLSAAAANLGGSGSGFVYTLSGLWQSKASWALQANVQKTSVVSNAYSRGFIYNNGGSSSPTNYGLRVVELITDDPWVGIAIHNKSGYKPIVYVDGYPIEENPTALIAGTPCYYRIDWSGVRKERQYTIYALASDELRGVAVLASSTLRAPTQEGLFGVAIGDSFLSTVSTYTLQYVIDDIGNQVFLRAGIKYPRNMNNGGTGYITGKTTSDNNTTSTTYAAKAVLQYNPNTDIASDVSLVVCAHGVNDSPSDTSAVAAGALDTWRQARSQYPNAFISIFGIWSENSGPSANSLAIDTALSNAFAGWGDTASAYHSVCADSAGAWTSGTGKWGATTGTGNADFYTGADGTHPSVPGREYLINRMVDKIESDLAGFGL